jgi:two-component system sensor histidine kinase AtoS
MVNCSPLQDAQGESVGLLVVISDITELKEMESRMRQADRLAALGTLSAGLAHEIRNPLSAIKTFVQLLPRKMSAPSFLEKFQITVPRELNRINTLIENLLEVARPPKMEFKAVALTDILGQLADLYRDELKTAKVELEIEQEEPLPELWGDGEHLLRAFSNLVINGKEAMPGGGMLTIKCHAVESRVRLQFIDRGIGVDETIRANMFNPFYTTKDRGTGLGLANAHKVIQEHEGTIEVGPTPGGGTTITVILPAVQE